MTLELKVKCTCVNLWCVAMQVAGGNCTDASSPHSDTHYLNWSRDPLSSASKEWQRPTKNSRATSDLVETSCPDRDHFLTCPTTIRASGVIMGFVVHGIPHKNDQLTARYCTKTLKTERKWWELKNNSVRNSVVIIFLFTLRNS